MNRDEIKKQKNLIYDNVGFSLVEVIVSMAILAIISFPIIISFSNSIRLNAKARTEENASAVGSQVIEDFKSLTTDDLTAYGTPTDTAGVLTYTTTKAGANGESFDVEVKLDPSTYTSNPSAVNEKNNKINSYEMPVYANINTNKNIIIRDDLYLKDHQAQEYFGVSNSKDIIKKTTINIELKKLSNLVYRQIYTINFSYTYTRGTSNTSDDVTITYSIAETATPDFITGTEDSGVISLDPKKIKPVYIMYAPYDVYSTSVASAVDNEYYARDYVEVNYTYPDEITDLKELDVFLVEQAVTFKPEGTTVSRSFKLKDSNITLGVSNKNSSGSLISTNVIVKDSAFTNSGTVNLSSSTSIAGPVSVYSNVSNWENFGRGSNSNSITSNGAQIKDYLYTITVTVKLNGKEIVTMSGTKEN